MEISKEIYINLVNCSWFKKCGCAEYYTYDFEIYPISTESEAVKGILSTKWENICLEERGNLTAYLSCNHKDKYKHWNYEVEIIKKEYLPQIRERLEKNVKEHNFSEEISKELLNEISFNIISIFMADFYSEYYQCAFYENVLKIYLTGQLPCGWDGKYPEGRIMVY